MASINYIQQYFKLQNTTAIHNRLHLAVYQSIYNQVYNAVLSACYGRQKKHVAKKVTNLYFFILFNCLAQKPNELSRTCNLSIDLLGQAIVGNNRNHILIYRDTLKLLRLIDYTSYYSPDRKTNKELTRYTVNISGGINNSSKKCIMVEYNIPDYSMDYYSNLCKRLHKISNNNSSSSTSPLSHNIYVSSSNVTSNPTMIYTRKCHIVEPFSKDQFLSRYSRLEYDGNPDPMSRDYQNIINMKAVKSPARIAEDGRIYHNFHNIEHEHRNNILFDGEHIVESFDVHNCNFCLLWSVLDDTVSESEKKRFYNLVISGKFYEEIMNYANLHQGEVGRYWDRDWTKEQCVAYLNTTQRTIAAGRRAIDKKKLTYTTKDGKYEFQVDGYYRAWVDKYFEENYPEVRNFINKVKNKDERKGALHYLLAPIETKIITFGIIKDLYEKYGIEALSLHDGIYVKESDAKYMKDNNISTERMFKEFINLSNLI